MRHLLNTGINTNRSRKDVNDYTHEELELFRSAISKLQFFKISSNHEKIKYVKIDESKPPYVKYVGRDNNVPLAEFHILEVVKIDKNKNTGEITMKHDSRPAKFSVHIHDHTVLAKVTAEEWSYVNNEVQKIKAAYNTAESLFNY